MVVHLHRPTSAAPVCGAPVPEDRHAGLTAWRSKITCPACLGTLRPLPPGLVCAFALGRGRYCTLPDRHNGDHA